MANTGNVFAGAGSTVDRAGAAAWTSPGNITSDNASNATTTTTPTDYLIASSFGFSSSVPANVSIQGITVRVEMAETGTGSSNYVLQLSTDTTPTLVGNVSGTITVTTGPTISTTGGTSDLWGTNLTAAQVRAAGFGVTLWSTDTINALQCDFITIAVEWTDVPQAWTPVRPQRRRKSTTNRRIPAESLVLTSGAPAATPSNDRTLEEPFRTRAIRSRRVMSTGWTPAMVAPPPQPAPGLYLDPPKVFRVEYVRKLKRTEPLDVYPPPTGPPPTAQGWPAWALPEASYRSSWQRRLLSVPEHETYPATPAPDQSDDRALEAPFVTRTLRSRRLLTAPPVIAVAPAAPQTSPGVLPAFTPTKVKRRKHRQGLFLSGDGPVEARVTAQYPAYQHAVQLERRDTHRALRRAAHNPSYPATPAQQAQPITAWTPVRALFKDQQRTRRAVPAHEVYPATPVAARMPAHVPVGFHRRRETEHTHRRVLDLDSYPTTAPVPPQPESAWRLKVANRIEHQRKLQPAAPQITYPATPQQPLTAWALPTAHRIERRRKRLDVPPHDSYPATVTYAANELVKANKRRATTRTLRIAAHADRYQQAPVPEQPPTAWKLAEAFRRFGWRVLRTVLELDEHPASPNRSEPKLNRTLRVGKPNRTNIVKSPDRTERATAPKRTEKP